MNTPRNNQQDEDKSKWSCQQAKQPGSISGSDRFTLWLSQKYMLIFILIILVYVGAPFLAPVFMKSGVVGPAKMIYMIYSPLCHQLAFRSWFLFGEQPVYPLELAGVNSLGTYEEYTGLSRDGFIACTGFYRQRGHGLQSRFV